jgi:hypothetical protein
MAEELHRLTELVEATPSPGWDWIWDAFWRLEGDRLWKVQGVSTPMGATMVMSVPGPIPWSVLVRWCDEHDRGPDDRDLLEVCVRAMDAIFLPWWHNRHRPRQT